MSKYYTIDVSVTIKPKGLPSQEVDVEIGGYIDGSGNAYDLSFRSGFFLENYYEASDFTDVFTSRVYDKKCQVRE